MSPDANILSKWWTLFAATNPDASALLNGTPDMTSYNAGPDLSALASGRIQVAALACGVGLQNINGTGPRYLYVLVARKQSVFANQSSEIRAVNADYRTKEE